MRRVLDLDPVGRAPGAIGPIAALGDDAFETHDACATENCIAIGAVDVIREPIPSVALRSNFASFHLRSDHGSRRRSTPSSSRRSKASRNASRDPLRPTAARILSKSLTPSGPHATPSPSRVTEATGSIAAPEQSQDALGPIVSPAAKNAQVIAVPTADDSEAVVLDLEYPLRPGGRGVGRGREARLDKAGGTAGGSERAPKHRRSYLMNGAKASRKPIITAPRVGPDQSRWGVGAGDRDRRLLGWGLQKAHRKLASCMTGLFDGGVREQKDVVFDLMGTAWELRSATWSSRGATRLSPTSTRDIA